MILEAEEFKYLKALLQDATGISLGESESEFVFKRLKPLAKQHGFADVQVLITALQSGENSDLQSAVIESIIHEETFFYRGLPAYEYILETVIPEIRSSEPDRAINIWCAACSSGQEAYSLPILIDHRGESLEDYNLHIIATDVNSSLVEKAKVGIYGQLEVSRGLPARVMLNNFDRLGREWQVQERHRNSVEFRVLNLIQDWVDLPTFDIVFLRNVLSYFQPSAYEKVMAKLFDQMKPGGYLFLGRKEAPPTTDGRFEAVKNEEIPGYRLLPE